MKLFLLIYWINSLFIFWKIYYFISYFNSSSLFINLFDCLIYFSEKQSILFWTFNESSILYLYEKISLGPSIFYCFTYLEEYLILEAFLILDWSDIGAIEDVFNSILWRKLYASSAYARFSAIIYLFMDLSLLFWFIFVFL